jgi:hypothetical protein
MYFNILAGKALDGAYQIFYIARSLIAIKSTQANFKLVA